MSTKEPTRIGSFVAHGKSSNLVTATKSVLSEQSSRLGHKHLIDLELIESVRSFIKAKCCIESNYCQALIKLCSNQLNKKFPTFVAENDCEIKSLYTVWRKYLEEEEKISKNRLAFFEQNAAGCDILKQTKAHKTHVGKKTIDAHLKRMHEEIIVSVSEIDKTRKFYFDEEHLAKQARDKEEKIKKRKGGIFSKFTDLQSKKEKSSAHREASNIQSTLARNEYLMALSAGNAHLDHYFNLDIPELMRTLDDEALDKCKGHMLSLLNSDLSSLNYSLELLTTVNKLLNTTSADFTNSAFISEAASSCLRETLQFEFEPCDNDTITCVSLEHNAELALKHEITKWISCFTKECRNINKLSQQLAKCQTLQTSGKKSVEVTGVGQVEIETRIDEIKQQLRKCEISKSKAGARLLAMKQGGMPLEDLEAIENQINSEMKQVSLDVDMGQPLSRTPSLKSTNISEGRISSMENKSFSDEQPESQEATPEPEKLPSELNESPEETYDENAGWGDYDATAAWETSQAQDQTNVGENAEDFSHLEGRYCRSLYAYDAQNEDELSFEVGQVMTIISAVDQHWLTAQDTKCRVGYIPTAFVEILDDEATAAYWAETNQETVEQVAEQLPSPPQEVIQESVQNVEVTIAHQHAYVKALYDYTAASNEEISFHEGDLIKILERSEDGWWLGEKDGIIGHFPSMLVEDEDLYKDDQAFESESESESTEFSMTPDGLPPPSYAPPKPAYLTPHQVVIIQPTPEIESRGTFGVVIEENENEENVSITIESSVKITTDDENQENNNIEQTEESITVENNRREYQETIESPKSFIETITEVQEDISDASDEEKIDTIIDGNADDSNGTKIEDALSESLTENNTIDGLDSTREIYKPEKPMHLEIQEISEPNVENSSLTVEIQEVQEEKSENLNEVIDSPEEVQIDYESPLNENMNEKNNFDDGVDLK